MNGSTPPLVSVLTPFHNTADLLETAIKSVLAQTWQTYEYVLVDNQSTDGSGDIARRWAARDPRIRIVVQPRLLGQVDNYNAALRTVNAGARYVKMVQADDSIEPECLQRMVEVAEQDPRVVIVASYYRYGDVVLFSGMPFQGPVVEGRAVCRLQLLWRNFFMGNPTTLLYRADAVRGRDPFFEPEHFHEDADTAFDLLTDGYLGFVPQVLSDVRRDDEGPSMTGAKGRFDWFPALQYTLVRRFGPRFLSADELRVADAAVTLGYGTRLLGGLLRRRGAAYFAFHDGRLREVGERWSSTLLPRWALRVAGATVMRGVRALARRIRP